MPQRFGLKMLLPSLQRRSLALRFPQKLRKRNALSSPSRGCFYRTNRLPMSSYAELEPFLSWPLNSAANKVATLPTSFTVAECKHNGCVPLGVVSLGSSVRGLCGTLTISDGSLEGQEWLVFVPRE